MTTNSSGFYVPSYLDEINGEDDFENLADSIMHIGDLRFKKVIGRAHTVNATDFDYVLRCDSEAVISIPEDKDMPAPIGTQIAVLNYSEKSVGIERIGDVVIAGSERRVVEKWRIGVLVKYDANFWLLSLGSGAGSQGTTTPTPPNLVTATGIQEGITLTWQKPVDDGGQPVTSYTAETSLDAKVWTVAGTFVGTQLSGSVANLVAQTAYNVRLRAQNSNGLSDSSNVLKATTTPKMPPPAPFLSYTAEGTFTIGNYNAAFDYKVTGATRNGNLLNGVSNGASINVGFDASGLRSNNSVMNVLNNGRILDPTQSYTDTGCGPRGDLCCPGGQIINAGGAQCGGAPGSFISDPSQAAAFCNGQCNDNCWQLTIQCYSYHYPDYSGDGYTLIGQTWGKAVNGTNSHGR
jgi:hypothetical protein